MPSDPTKMKLTVGQIVGGFVGLAGFMTVFFALAIGLQLVQAGPRLGGHDAKAVLIDADLRDHVTKKHSAHPDMKDLARTDESLIRLETKLEGVRGAVVIMDKNITERVAKVEQQVTDLVDTLRRRRVVRRGDVEIDP